LAGVEVLLQVDLCNTIFLTVLGKEVFNPQSHGPEEDLLASQKPLERGYR